MLIRRGAGIRASEITDESLYLSRRLFLETAGVGAAAAVLAPGLAAASPVQAGESLPPAQRSPFSTNERPNSWEDITGYNNFYEFGTDKEDPRRNASRLKVRPWTLKVDGLVSRPADYAIDDLIKLDRLEERIYRLRCVEAWSMVIPWIGFPLADVIRKVGPSPKAKYVAFETLLRPAEMPGQRTNVLDWPYREGLRLDEAMHPLTILAVGLYGKVLPNQDGAPIRLVVPWKYGFKSIKSIVRMSLVERQPPTSWSTANPGEYGFYSNVNPQVDHPRWSQASERRLGEFFRRKTLPFNGYGDQVASLYSGMDLRKNF